MSELLSTTEHLVEGAGNRFLLLDGHRDRGLLEEVQGPRSRCEEKGVDGLLLLLPPEGQGEFAMVIFNADGSRPEACGNGLRCLAHFAYDRGLLVGDEAVIETDAGPRRVRRRGARTEVSLGQPRLVMRSMAIEVSGEVRPASIVDLGNPHCVLPCPDPAQAPVEAWGSALQFDPRFPDGINVEFASGRGADLRMRVYERGVGETEACGTGAAAVAYVRSFLEGRSGPVRVHCKGGELQVDQDEAGELWLSGPVRL